MCVIPPLKDAFISGYLLLFSSLPPEISLGGYVTLNIERFKRKGGRVEKERCLAGESIKNQGLRFHFCFVF